MAPWGWAARGVAAEGVASIEADVAINDTACMVVAVGGAADRRRVRVWQGGITTRVPRVAAPGSGEGRGCGIAGTWGCLTQASLYVTVVCMRTTLNIDDDMLNQAARLTGVREKTALVRMGLEALVARRSAQRLAALGGTEPQARRVPRRGPAT